MATEFEITEQEEAHTYVPAELGREGPLLLSMTVAARELGIPTTLMREISYRGDVESLYLGKRRYVKRASLLDFIDRVTKRGWYR